MEATPKKDKNLAELYTNKLKNYSAKSYAWKLKLKEAAATNSRSCYFPDFAGFQWLNLFRWWIF